MEFHWGPSAKAQVRSTVKPSCSDSLRRRSSSQQDANALDMMHCACIAAVACSCSTTIWDAHDMHLSLLIEYATQKGMERVVQVAKSLGQPEVQWAQGI